MIACLQGYVTLSPLKPIRLAAVSNVHQRPSCQGEQLCPLIPLRASSEFPLRTRNLNPVFIVAGKEVVADTAALAVSPTPPTWVIVSSTRNSLSVRPKVLATVEQVGRPVGQLLLVGVVLAWVGDPRFLPAAWAILSDAREDLDRVAAMAESALP